MSTSDENNRILTDLRSLGLHITLKINDNVDVMKVPGGLLYTTKYYNGGTEARYNVATSFVPYNPYERCPICSRRPDGSG